MNGGQLQNASLSNGESFKIDSLKPGDEIIVTEVSGGEDGYTTEYTVKGATTTGNTYKATLGEDDESYEVVFTNTRCIVPPTGLSDNMAPFAAMTLAGLGAAGDLLPAAAQTAVTRDGEKTEYFWKKTAFGEEILERSAGSGRWNEASRRQKLLAEREPLSEHPAGEAHGRSLEKGRALKRLIKNWKQKNGQRAG